MREKRLLRWAGILLVFTAFYYVCIEAQSGQEPVEAPGSGRSDLIKIDTLAAFEKLELPAVTFFHDRHTDALLREQKNCETCHFVEDNKLSLTFKRWKATKPAEIKDIYHSNCIGCHMEMAAAGKKTGPPDGLCRSCHDAKPKIAAARIEVGLDKVLHFRHVDSKSIPGATAQKDNCGQCHHEYDQRTKKTFYAKGKEETCRYCHLDKPKDGVTSLRQASHLQCVLCHLDLANQGVKENGPYLCASCHGAKGRAQVDKKNREAMARLPNQEVPRLRRGQPDAALITYDPKSEGGKAGKSLLMNPVAFDHKAHEKYNNTCRVCHHAAMDSCQKCHTLSGVKEGKFVTFEQAMHLKSSQQSCIGCHTRQQAASNCSGCHNHLDKTRRPDDVTCRQCHLPLPEAILREAGMQRDNLLKLTEQQKAGSAETMLKGRNLTPGTYAVEDIPEKVLIKGLADKYEPSELTHRKHVLSLLNGMKGNSLAGYFHREPGTICQACHHHSPPAKQPPSCGNCHSSDIGAKESNRPALQASFHGQCMGCHKDMGLEKPAATACTECHAEKKK